MTSHSFKNSEYTNDFHLNGEGFFNPTNQQAMIIPWRIKTSI